MNPQNNVPDTGIQDLRVRLRPCPGCRCITGSIDADNAVACDCCRLRRLDLDQPTQRFLHNFISIFGRPIDPIRISTSPQPSGAGADDVIPAPLGD
jgi:hypothetical protein